jgi:hypothetical protein
MTEFDDVIRLLEDERPQATDLELDAIKQRVRRRAADPSRRSTQSMKSRFAILGMLVAGMLFSTAGAGLAVSGLNSSTNASLAQYGTATPTPVCTMTPTPTPTNNNAPGATGNGNHACSNAPEGGVLPAEAQNTPTPTSTPGSGTAPATDTGVAPATDTQTTRQEAAAATTSQLPFTGFAAIPVLLGGLALLGGGLVLRRRTRSE